MEENNCPSTQSLSKREQLLLSILDDAADSEGQLLGRMKLMKLVFFSEYWQDNEGQLTSEKQLGGFDDFKIYKYGPFSEKLLHTFDSLKNLDLVREQEQMYGPTQINLTESGHKVAKDVRDHFSTDEKRQLYQITSTFGDKDGNELEEESLDRLGITREEKSNHQGRSVENLIA
jgi:uncharacterized protein YwgA